MSLPYLAPRRAELPRRPILNIVAVVLSTLLALCSTAAAQEGTDGALTVTAANTVLNQYAVLGANAAAGTTSFSVTNVADLSSSAYGALARGDLLMLYQPQGASINTADNAGFGAVTNLNSAGRYEVISSAASAATPLSWTPRAARCATATRLPATRK